MSDRHTRRAQADARAAIAPIPLEDMASRADAWRDVITRHQQAAETAQARAEAKRARKAAKRTTHPTETS